MKAEAESDDKHKHDEKELEHGEADVPEHQNEDAEGGELLEVGEQVEPGHRQDERPNWPTPTLQKHQNNRLRPQLTMLPSQPSPMSQGIVMLKTKPMEKR